MTSELKTLDPDVREIIIDYFTKVINHTYDEAKKIRLLLKLQNLTIEDIIIPSPPEPCQQVTSSNQEIQTLQESLKQVDQEKKIEDGLNRLVNQTSNLKINPIPSKIDIDDLEFCYLHLNYLIPTQKQFITDNFRSRTDNAVTDFNGNPITFKMRQNLNRCVSKIKKAQEKEKGI